MLIVDYFVENYHIINNSLAVTIFGFPQSTKK